MRHIKFRAKNINGQWRHGYLERQDLLYDEDYDCSCTIQIDTIGEFAGLIDKNGKEIYEGDIIVGDIPELLNSSNLTGVVKYQDSGFIVKIPNRKSWEIQKVGFCSFVNYEVIGNIYDNAELLGE